MHTLKLIPILYFKQIINRVQFSEEIAILSKNLIFKTLLDLTDVCLLLTKQYTQVGLQIQYVLYNF
jgi:hypothetical protein